MLLVIFACVHAACFMTVLGQGFVEQAPDGQSGTIKFGPPDLSDEMSSSIFVPDSLKCDACRAISYQMWSAFTKYNEKHKYYNFKLPESVVIDLLDDVCVGDGVWIEYGTKQAKGTQMLSGPGLEAADTPGVTASGGKWPARLRDMCDVFVGELGETTIYKVFHHAPTKRGAVEDFLCRGQSNTLRGSCTPRKPQKRPTSKNDL